MALVMLPMPCQAGSPQVKPFESAACGAQVALHRVLPSNVLTQSQEPSRQVCLSLETFRAFSLFWPEEHISWLL